MVQIIPAILATSEEGYRRDIYRIKRVESFKEGWVHIDFMDNIFVPNESISPSVVAKNPISLHKEAHLMVSRPLDWVDGLIEAEFERIIIHIEAEDVDKCIDYIKGKGLEAGLAIKMETPIENLEPFVGKIDVVMVMGVSPGLQSQEFIYHSIDKMKELKSKDWKVRIGIDGGVKDTNIAKIVEAGANFVAIGSFILKGDIEENLENLWEIING